MDKWQRGVTLLEAIIVVGLIAVIVAIAIPLFVQILQSYTAQTAASTMSTNIRFARNAAVKKKEYYRVVVNDAGESTPNTYKIQTSLDNITYTDYTKIDPDLPGGVEIKSGSVDTITFNFRGGATLNPSGQSITLEAPNDTTYLVQVSLTGAVTVTKQ